MKNVHRILGFVLALCAATGGSAAAQDRPIRVGVTAGPHAQIAEVAKQVAARDGLTLQIVEFNDYVQPDAALDAGDLDANSYQHLPFLEGQIAARGYKIVSVGLTVTFPMGFYSRRYKSLDAIPDGGTIGIPNDPSNSGRALLLLQKYGVLKLVPNAGVGATPRDIVENRRKLKIVQVDAAQLPRSLDDVDAAAINTNYAMTAGLVPARDAIAIEDAKGPYANLLAVRIVDRDKPWVAKLVRAFQSREVSAFVAKNYAGSLVTAY
jgi:D-methionine transport system substrate-binding protein